MTTTMLTKTIGRTNGGFLRLVLVNQAKTEVKPHLTIVNHSKE